MTKRKCRSEIAKAVHRLGLVDKQTMREFDLRCLTSVAAMRARDVKALRRREGVSQAVFAPALNVTANHVSQAERGATLKLLSLVKHKGLAAIL